ncbi:MAG: hypothetical protein NZ840_08410 [Anaerolineales bacterium]|nr:hypothetical protein [Anaerolineales bacterium]MDW8162063.1 hypothetical protein [Anaerolineales bacterium]
MERQPLIERRVLTTADLQASSIHKPRVSRVAAPQRPAAGFAQHGSYHAPVRHARKTFIFGFEEDIGKDFAGLLFIEDQTQSRRIF